MDDDKEFDNVYSSPPPSFLPLPPDDWFEPDDVVFKPMPSSAPSKPKHPP